MNDTKNGKKLNKALLVGTALVSLTTPNAANALDITGSMSAIILAPLGAAADQVLHFGSMIATDATGTLVVAPVAGRAAGAGGITTVIGSALEQAGNINVSAGVGQVVNLTVGAGPFTVDDGGAGLAMTVDTFNLGTDAAGPTVTAVVLTGNTDIDIPVGARLNMPTGQATALAAATAATTFTGTYTVSVNYN